MKALVVYDSVYGNTKRIAGAIAEAIASFGEVKVLGAGETNLSELESIDFLIVGSPTHGGRPTPDTREFLKRIPANALEHTGVASFDTRVRNIIAKLFGYAAGRIAATLKKKGGTLIVSPEGFFVKGTKGPLEEGELERAASWAKGIVESKK